MLKGVNKQIIEVNDIENEHFYKAILFVRPERGTKSAEYLSKRADEYILAATDELERLPEGFLRNRVGRKNKTILIASICSFLVLCGTVALFLLL